MARKDSTASTDSNRTVPDVFSVHVRSLHGQLAPGNQNSLAWSWNGMIAFGCQTQVVVAETRDPSLNVIQTLDKHKYLVSIVKWPRDATLRLASVDIKSNIIIWDVLQGSMLTMITGESKDLKGSVVQLEWVKGDTGGGKNPTGTYILVLYSSNTLVLYDTELGDISWKKSFATGSNVEYNLKDFSLDPFSKSSAIASLSSANAQNIHCCFAHFENLMSNTVKMKRYQLYVHDSDNANSPVRSPRLQLAIKQVATSLFKSDQEEPSNYLLEYKQLLVNQSRRNEVIFLFPHEIVVANLTNVQIMSVIATERNSSPVVELYPCRQRCGIYSLHESGNVIFRLLQHNVKYEAHINTNVTELSYTSICHSEGIRLTKQNRIVGFSVLPTCETKVALLLNNGRVLIKQIIPRTSNNHQPITTLSNLFPLEYYDAKQAEEHQLKERFKFIQNQLLGSLLAPTIIKSCPPITKFNWRYHRPLLAVGDASGAIQIFDLSNGRLEKEFSVHTTPVRGLEWVSLNAFISYSCPNLTRNSNKINNELYLTDIPSGRSEPIRVDRNLNSSPIEALRVSHLKQYFILTFKNEPFEIWDLKSLCLLRVMPKKFSSVTAVEWSPLYNRKQSSQAAKIRESFEEDMTASGPGLDESGDSINRETKERTATPELAGRTAVSIKENFVITNGHGELYHFSVEGMITKEISCIPRDASHGQITTIAWKGDQVILGDADGNLHYWDLKKKQSSTKSSHRGWVKKVRFGPGRGNMKCIVLYSDGVEIWDVQEMHVFSELKSPRDMSFKLLDVDWAGSDRPILATNEGFILVTDLRLKRYSSPIKLSSVKDEIFNSNMHLAEPKSRTSHISKYLHQKGEEDPETLLSRCIEVAYSMGDRAAIDFWYLVGHHVLNGNKRQPIFSLDDNYELFLKNARFRQIQLERVATFEAKRSLQEHNKLCVEYHILLGNHQRAVQLLLDSDSQSREKYYTDALKACLIAALNASHSNDSSVGSDTDNDNSPQPVLKLVATSLIAAGSVEEGTQLLYLIGKVQDACRYLQSNGSWEKSVWVAKTYLSDEESQEIVRRWLDHLILQNEREVELFVLLSMRNFEKVLETLTNRQELEVAALFADICNASNVLPSDAKVTVDFVYLKYSQWLTELGLDDIADRYKDKVSQ